MPTKQMPSLNRTFYYVCGLYYGKRDKSKNIATEHPLAVYSMLCGAGIREIDILYAALLHDVVEDYPVSLDDLRNMGYSQEVINILKLLTHPKITEGISPEEKQELYEEYIQKIINSENVGAILIKYCDMCHNLSPIRLEKLLPDKQQKLINKYSEPKRLLEETLQNTKYSNLVGRFEGGVNIPAGHIFVDGAEIYPVARVAEVS